MKQFTFIIIAAAAFAAALTVSGCVNRQLAESYSQFLDTAGTEYIQYVESDQNLTGDDKAIRRANVGQAVSTVKRFKATKWSW